MTSIKESVIKSLQRASLTFKTFPVTLASAAGFTIVTLIRIWMDWPQQEDYNFLFNCLHLSLAASAILGLAMITAVQRRYNSPRAFALANSTAAALGALFFLLLFLFGGAEPSISRPVVTNVSGLVAARMSVVMILGMIGFIYFAGQHKEESDFPSALFMTQKAFLIAAIYGGVMMGGTSGVAGAIQALLYRNMSEKVYMVLSALIGFIAFAIFVGYFPDFKKDSQDPHRAIAETQPRFIEVLFEFIMVPIVVVLTVVLLAWAAKTVVTGEWPSFSRMAGIVISYSIGGTWLTMMVAKKESSIAQFYRRVYPITLLIILVFGAWAFVGRLSESGMRKQEYYFMLVMIAASVSAILLLVLKGKAYAKIAGVVCLVAAVSVLPLVGYYILPVRLQLNRLESLLVEEGILVNGKLVAAQVEPEIEARIAITNAVDFLAFEEEAELPEWFDDNLANQEIFKEKMGFEKTWKDWDQDFPERDPERLGMFLMMPNATIDISEYDWALYLRKAEPGRSEVRSETIVGERGTYRFDWMTGDGDQVPNLTVWLDGTVILQEDLKTFMDQTAEAVRERSGPFEAKGYEEMSVMFETPEISVLLVFQHMNLYLDPQEDIMEYYLELDTLYVNEK